MFCLILSPLSLQFSDFGYSRLVPGSILDVDIRQQQFLTAWGGRWVGIGSHISGYLFCLDIEVYLIDLLIYLSYLPYISPLWEAPERLMKVKNQQGKI